MYKDKYHIAIIKDITNFKQAINIRAKTSILKSKSTPNTVISVTCNNYNFDEYYHSKFVSYTDCDMSILNTLDLELYVALYHTNNVCVPTNTMYNLRVGKVKSFIEYNDIEIIRPFLDIARSR